jgi:hypothetical protein
MVLVLLPKQKDIRPGLGEAGGTAFKEWWVTLPGTGTMSANPPYERTFAR